MLSPLLPPPLLAEAATFSVFSVVFKAAAAAANVSRQLSNGAGKYPEGAWGTAGGGRRGCIKAGLKKFDEDDFFSDLVLLFSDELLLLLLFVLEDLDDLLFGLLLTGEAVGVPVARVVLVGVLGLAC